MMRMRTLCFFVSSLTAVAGALAAQARPTPGTVVSVERWRLEPGQRLRVYTRGVGVVHGSLLSMRDQELLIQSGPGPNQTAIRLAWIDSLWVQTTASQQWALYGGAGGTALGAVIGALVCGSRCSDRSVGALLGGLTGAGAGALGGGLLGRRRFRWSRRYP